MILQIYLLLFSAYKRNEGYSITGHGKPWSLHGLSTLCESLRDCDGLVIAALFNLHGFWLFVFDVMLRGFKTMALKQSSPASTVSVKSHL